MFLKFGLEVGALDVETEKVMTFVCSDGEERHERGCAAYGCGDAVGIVVGAGLLRETACAEACFELVERPIGVKFDPEDPF